MRIEFLQKQWFKRVCKVVGLCLVISISLSVHAQVEGLPDFSFNSGGTGTDNVVGALALQADGKILIGGSFTKYNGVTLPKPYLARLNENGTLDTSFNLTASFTTMSYVEAIAIQPDGKILVGGNFYSVPYSGSSKFGIVRLNSDGTLDVTFNATSGTGANGSIKAIAVQTDGKIIIGGNFYNYNGAVDRTKILRLTSAGVEDVTFNIGTGSYAGINGVAAFVYTITIQGDGKILVGGTFTAYNGTLHSNIVRINTNGSVDANFNPTNGAAGTSGTVVSDIEVLPNDSILLVGNFSNYGNANPARVRLAKALPANGAYYSGFATGTGPGPNSITSVMVQPDGKILIAGNFTKYDGVGKARLARLTADGVLDPAFNPGTGGADGQINKALLQPDGKILISGGFTGYMYGTPLSTYNMYGIARISNGTCSTPPVLTATDSVSCNGGDNGSATVTPVINTGNYTYLWSDGQTDSIATNLPAGEYAVTVNNNNGCAYIINNIIVAQPQPVSAQIDSVVNASCQNCADGSAGIVISGGTAPYSITWNVTPAKDDSILAHLSAGDYTVTVTDNKGCTDTATFTIGVDLSTGLDENNVSPDIKVIPNPVMNEFFIEQAFTQNKSYSLKIMGVTGQEVYSKNKLDNTSIRIDATSWGKEYITYSLLMGRIVSIEK